MTAVRHSKWNELIGARVEIRRNLQVVRSGVIEEAMPDSSCLWLAADAPHQRTLIDAAEGYEVWIEPRELNGKYFHRTTAWDLTPAAQLGGE
jgi:hypothetical protein